MFAFHDVIRSNLAGNINMKAQELARLPGHIAYWFA
tara:strand:- start:286 stop:393 length:108 start_codon:yes stop_codon:yes gene_type:complete